MLNLINAYVFLYLSRHCGILFYTLEDLKWDKRQTNKYLIFLKMANISISKTNNKS